MSPRLAPLAEALLVLVVGVTLGLGANAMRARGLDLGRDHFPRSVVPVANDATADVAPAEPEEADAELESAEQPVDPEPEPAPEDTPPAAEEPAVDPIVAARLAAKGLSAVGLAEMQAFVADDNYGYGLYMLLDARRPSEIEAGHISGARAWDPYAPELSATDELLSELLGAMRVVVYCNGGDCEDSETAALQLLGFGVNPAGLAVFAGGWAEWTAAGLPTEKGAP